jgi:hypothetical protein
MSTSEEVVSEGLSPAPVSDLFVLNHPEVLPANLAHSNNPEGFLPQDFVPDPTAYFEELKEPTHPLGDVSVIFGDQREPDYIFPEGTLNKSVSHVGPLLVILTQEEEAQISEAKEILVKALNEIQTQKELHSQSLERILDAKKLGCRLLFECQLSSGAMKEFTEDTMLPELKRQRVSLEEKAMKYIDFLASKASKLTRASKFERAQTEYRYVVELLKKLYDSEHHETLMYQIDYGTAQLLDGEGHQNGLLLIVESVAKLEKKLSKRRTAEENNEIKESLAIAYFTLAQYYYNAKREMVQARTYLDKSKNLRIEYGASDVEMDRIQFLHGRILDAEGDMPGAFEILASCYNFRKSKEELKSSLRPVLGVLADIANRTHKPFDEMRFLIELLEIQRGLNIDKRTIITTQLRMLKAMAAYAPFDEYQSVLQGIKKDLNSIPVTKESVGIAFNYIDLVEATIAFLPVAPWPFVTKKNLCREMLKFLAKAERHLNAAREKSQLIIEQENRLNSLKVKCSDGMFFFEDPTIKGSRLHPEDEADLAERAMFDAMPANDGIVFGSSTAEGLRQLSEYSSEVDHSLIPDEDKVVTPEEFEELPDNGHINPFRLRAAQGGINPKFRDGHSLEEMKQALVNDPAYTQDVPPIEIGVHEGAVYSFDTRRLVVHQEAREINPSVNVRYRKISGEHLEERKKVYSPRPWKGFVTAKRYDGKNSDAMPYVNPAVRSQIEEKVLKDFKFHPSDRKNADPNGFPVLRYRARKIQSFFSSRKKGKNSRSATLILGRLEAICRKEGADAGYNFLVGLKKGP